MMTLLEASFEIMDWLMHIERTEGHMPNIVGIHSIEHIGDGTCSIYLNLDDPNANQNTPGVIICRVDERAVLDMDRDELMQALMLEGYTVH